MEQITRNEAHICEGGIVPAIAYGLFAGGLVLGAWIYAESDEFIAGFNAGEGHTCK